MNTALATQTEVLIKPASRKEEILFFRRKKIEEIEKFRKDKLSKSKEKELEDVVNLVSCLFYEDFVYGSNNYLSISTKDIKIKFFEDEYLIAIESLVAINACKDYWRYVARCLLIPVCGWLLMLSHDNSYRRKDKNALYNKIFYDSRVARGWRYYRRRKWLMKNGFDPVEEIKKGLLKNQNEK